MVEHYFTKSPTSTEREYVINDMIRGNKLTFYSSSGVFSKDHIDPATRLLAQRCQVTSGMNVLDLGCGYGAVGIAVKKAFPKVSILATDVNERAVELTAKNATENSVEISVRQGHLYDLIPETFDVILVNPPQTAGKDICFAMIDLAPSHLNTNGEFYLVARPAKGGKTLAKRMEEKIGPVDVVGRRDGYAVYRAVYAGDHQHEPKA